MAGLILFGLSAISRRILGSTFHLGTDFWTTLIPTFMFPTVLSLIFLILIAPILHLWDKALPSRTIVIPESIPWYRQPAVLSAVAGAAIAVMAVLTFVFITTRR